MKHKCLWIQEQSHKCRKRTESWDCASIWHIQTNRSKERTSNCKQTQTLQAQWQPDPFFFQTGCILRASPNWAGWEKLRTEPFYISPLQRLHFFIGQYSNCSKVWKDLRLSDRQSMMKDRGWQKQKNLSWGWTNWSIDSGSKRLLIWVTNCLQPDLEKIKTITDMTSPKDKSQIKHRVDGNLKSLMTECPNFKQRSEGHPWNADSLTHSYSNEWSQILPCGGCYCCRQKSHKLVNWRAHFVFSVFTVGDNFCI